MITDLKAVTWNIGGWRDPSKRNKIRNYLLSLRPQWICLQEIHGATPRELLLWESEWPKYEWCWNPSDSSHSAGVAVGISRDWLASHSLTIKTQEKSIPGRLLIVDILKNDKLHLQVASLYAPASSSAARKDFFIKAMQILPSEGVLYLGGDINCMECHQDKLGNGLPNLQGAKQTRELKDKLGLVDLWRANNPRKSAATHWSHFHFSASRIDVWWGCKENQALCEVSHLSEAPPLSDHDPVFLKVAQPISRPKAHWKLNQRLLQNPIFTAGVKKAIKELQQECLPVHIMWEKLKRKIKALAKSFPSVKQQQAKLTSLQSTRAKVVESLHKDPKNFSLWQEKTLLEAEIKDLLHALTEAARRRSRIKHVWMGESMSKFFFSREKKRAAENTILQLKCKDSKGFVSTPAKILQEVEVFYSQLFGWEPVNQDAKSKLLKVIKNKLNQGEAQVLNSPLTEKEVHQAIKILPNNKAPGADGIPTEFFKAFEAELVPIMVQLFNFIKDKETMPASMCQGLLNMIHKKGDRADLSNYRPITLMRSDYKILAKVLAETSGG